MALFVEKHVITLFLLFSYGFDLVQFTFILHCKKPVTVTTTAESLSRFGYRGCSCADKIWQVSEKIQLHRRRYIDLVHRLQKKVCEKFFNYIKLRLRVNEFSIDNPCNV